MLSDYFYLIKYNLKDYKTTPNSEHLKTCSYDKGAEENEVCKFSSDDLGNCSPTRSNRKYGFPERKPCIFLKLNKVSTMF